MSSENLLPAAAWGILEEAYTRKAVERRVLPSQLTGRAQ